MTTQRRQWAGQTPATRESRPEILVRTAAGRLRLWLPIHARTTIAERADSPLVLFRYGSLAIDDWPPLTAGDGRQRALSSLASYRPQRSNDG